MGVAVGGRGLAADGAPSITRPRALASARASFSMCRLHSFHCSSNFFRSPSAMVCTTVAGGLYVSALANVVRTSSANSMCEVYSPRSSCTTNHKHAQT